MPYVYAEQGIIALSKSILPIPFPRYSGSTPSLLVFGVPPRRMANRKANDCHNESDDSSAPSLTPSNPLG